MLFNYGFIHEFAKYQYSAAFRKLNSTGIDDLFDVFIKLVPVKSRWKHIGKALRLIPNELDDIEKENSQPDDCLIKVLTLWLNKCYDTDRYGDPSWKLLAKAVGRPAGGNNRAVSQDITAGNCMF